MRADICRWELQYKNKLRVLELLSGEMASQLDTLRHACPGASIRVRAIEGVLAATRAKMLDHLKELDRANRRIIAYDDEDRNRRRSDLMASARSSHC